MSEITRTKRGIEGTRSERTRKALEAEINGKRNGTKWNGGNGWETMWKTFADSLQLAVVEQFLPQWQCTTTHLPLEYWMSLIRLPQRRRRSRGSETFAVPRNEWNRMQTLGYQRATGSRKFLRMRTSSSWVRRWPGLMLEDDAIRFSLLVKFSAINSNANEITVWSINGKMYSRFEDPGRSIQFGR